MTDVIRQQCRETLKQSVDASVWETNRALTQSLLAMMEAHPVSRHPILADLTGGKFSGEAIQAFHMDFHHAVSQVFIDVVMYGFTSNENSNWKGEYVGFLGGSDLLISVVA